MAGKEALLHDIDIVTTFSSKYDMKNPALAGKYATFLESKRYFATGVGTSYIQRLKEIQQGKTNEPCFVCKKNPSHDGVLCDACMNKYSQGKKQFYGHDDLADLDALFSGENVDNIKSKSQGAVNQLKAAKNAAMSKASDISGKVQSRLQEEDVQKVKEKIAPTINAASEKAKKFAKDNNIEGKVAVAKDQANKAKKEAKHLWGRMSRIQRIAVAAVAVVLIVSGVGFFLNIGGGVLGAKSGEKMTSPSGMELDVLTESGNIVKDEKDAEKVAKSLFSESDGWKIDRSSVHEWPRGHFWGPIGYNIKLVEKAIPDFQSQELLQSYYKTETVYIIYMVKPAEFVRLYINSNGRVLSEGTVNKFDDVIYRIK